MHTHPRAVRRASFALTALAGGLTAVAGIAPSVAMAASVNTVFIDSASIGPLPSTAGLPAFPYLERQLAARLAESLREKQIKVVEVTGAAALQDIKLNDLYVSLSYATMDQGLAENGKYSGFAVYVSQQNPQFETSLSCAWQVGNALAGTGEKPWAMRAGASYTLIDPTGIREYSGLSVPKVIRGPTLFVEAGMFAGERERVRLSSPETLQKMADAIADGIDRCRN